MKNAVTIFVSAILGVMTLVIVMTVLGRMNRSVELQSNLSSAVEKTVSHMSGEEELRQGSEAAVAECVEGLAFALDTDSDVEVKVMKADHKKGVLAISVIEKFRYLNGNTGTTEWSGTSIWNRVEEPEPEQYEVRFYKTREDMLAEENCYKSYVVEDGEKIAAPAAPIMEDAEFAGWRDRNDYVADFSQPVEQNQVYYADW